MTLEFEDGAASGGFQLDLRFRSDDPATSVSFSVMALSLYTVRPRTERSLYRETTISPSCPHWCPTPARSRCSVSDSQVSALRDDAERTDRKRPDRRTAGTGHASSSHSLLLARVDCGCGLLALDSGCNVDR